MSVKKLTVATFFSAVLALTGFGLMPASAHNNNSRGHNFRHNDNNSHEDTNPDINQARLYRDGSVSCSGADNTSKRGGKVFMMAGVNEVHFKIKLKNASPNTVYNLAVSEEPDCTNAQSLGSQTTDANGNATFYGSYSTTAGEHNLLFNLVTSSPNTPENREISTQNAMIMVPGS